MYSCWCWYCRGNVFWLKFGAIGVWTQSQFGAVGAWELVAIGVLGLDRGISAHFCCTHLAQSYYPSAAPTDDDGMMVDDDCK
jgi:hypothetical protein